LIAKLASLVVESQQKAKAKDLTQRAGQLKHNAHPLKNEKLALAAFPGKRKSKTKEA
jgi:hypothetical protein|tara:strand:- start:125 stop:295 length:171 start_codon:yes stop_codon:yes gene_type:complete